ncbi:hypothetical protein KY290_025932 [Solanum tuberosum]|uniref:Uncharacterized protein n=1 Tax=Solanum tuberosum TaxID=4113 RepID=A0ABQ7UX49_SOLTU|nr:hypothetical protein KY289_025009 [Solanum tuberosum]KAH0673660.1 hypothetical protein KY284_024747 [Solanum tuberosum]KAH0676994.1 hypothetical protein KY285_024795 [Solanum tuberosum]KAH0755662.1 hypothetical protein KY290_025932 [Solanum tuberosum]
MRSEQTPFSLFHHAHLLELLAINKREERSRARRSRYLVGVSRRLELLSHWLWRCSEARWLFSPAGASACHGLA